MSDWRPKSASSLSSDGIAGFPEPMKAVLLHGTLASDFQCHSFWQSLGDRENLTPDRGGCSMRVKSARCAQSSCR